MFHQHIQYSENREPNQLNKTLAREMKQARNIQMKLLNATKPIIKSGEITGVSIPARLVGGDYFDFIELPNGHIRIVIGDVMGKGIPAAMLMILTRGVFRSSVEHFFSPSETLKAMNEFMFQDLRTLGSFVTLLCADYDPVNHTLTYASAGHNLPIVITKNKVRKDIPFINGIMIGGLATSTYKQFTIDLLDEDIVFFYTDGITDTLNEHGEAFKMERLVELLERNCQLQSDQIEKAVLKRIGEFTNGELQKDDITLIILKVKEELDCE
ncbi:PP2C family protein-serine/threonine phosphatase [Gracilibacillus marinus]|uniref:PP2C family protein-serine/threonine phosphatase n=1 Tax=Gracilibacillus marinus TaxID=630535 RepID=A0ABV8VXB8_9BACI